VRVPALHYWIGGAVLATYLLTLCPGIYVGDSGELVTASALLGVAHPPGYPLYVLLGRLFSLLPVGEVALRVNLFSAAAGAAAAGCLALLLLSLPGAARRSRRGAAIAATVVILLFAFSRTAWSQMVVAEVYGLNLFMIALTLLALFRGKRPMLTFFLLGLGAANHQTILLLLPGTLFYYGVTRTLSWRLALEGSAAFLLAASLYLFLIVRPDSIDLFAWRKPNDWGALLAHITRAQYGSLSKLPWSVPLFLSQVAFAFRFVLRELPLAIPLVPLGLFLAWRKGGSLAARTFSIHLLFTSLGLLLLLNPGTDRLDAAVASVFYIPAILFAALLMEPVIRIAAQRLEETRAKLSYLLIAIPLFPLLLNYGVCDARSFNLGDQAGRAMLAGVEEDAWILTEGDNSTFMLYYLQLVEGERPDVRIFDRDLNFFARKMGIDPGLPGRKSARDRAVFRLVSSPENDVYATSRFEEKELAGRSLASTGPLYRFVESNEEIRPSSIDLVHSDPLNLDHLRDDYIARRFAIAYLARWVDHYSRSGDINAFRETSDRLTEIGGDLREAHLVIGMGAASSGDTTAALRSLEQSLQVDPDFAAARRELAGIFVGLENYERAAEEYRLAVDHEGRAGDWLNLANALYFAERLEESEEAYRKAVDTEGATDLVLRGAARGLGKLGVDSLGVVLLERLRTRSPETFSEYEELAGGYDRLGDPEKALVLYRRAAEEDPGSVSIGYKTGVALIRLGRMDEAEEELEGVLALDSRVPGAMNALAYLYVTRGKDLGRALQLASDAVETAGEGEIGYYEDTRGVILSRLGRMSEAEAAFRNSLEKTPADDRAALSETWIHLADLLGERGDRRGEMECRREAESALRR